MVNRAGRRRRSDVVTESGSEQGRAAVGPAELERLAWLLDSSIRLPGGFRIGIDGLIGLIPGFGDAVAALMSLYIVGRAAAAGIPKPVIARMLVNVGLDGIVGAVPVLGDLFDFYYKANQRNVTLLQRYAADPRRERRAGWLVITGIVLLLILAAALIVAIGVLLARALMSLF